MKNEITKIWIDLNEELYKFILLKIKDEQISKDLHQEVFLKIQNNIHQLEHTSKLTPWVYQITRNTIIDYFRKAAHQEKALAELAISDVETSDFHYANLSTCINQKIDQLSEKHKEVIMLTAFQSYSQKEVAEQLKISYSGTKSRVQKAREILKENILGCPNVEADNTGKLIDFEK